MITAIIIFVAIYALMLALPKLRPYIALGGGLIFVILGLCGVYPMTPLDALGNIDFNVLLMIAGTMGVVTLFIESKMPALLAELIITKVPNVMWAVTALALFAGIVSAFVDNVATVLMIAPVGLAISKKLNISPIPVLIAISVSSNLQGAATLVGDTTSIMLASAADMNFLEFFFMEGKLGIFFSVELGAIVAALILLFMFRKQKQPISATVETKVNDLFPSILMIATVLLLIIASFIPSPNGGFWKAVYDIRAGLICLLVCIVGVVRRIILDKNANALKSVLKDLDKDTLLLLIGIFVIIQGIKAAGVIDELASLIVKWSGNKPFLLYTIIVFASVVISAFIDNIPYVATMLTVVATVAAQMNVDPTVFYFGLLTGATLGGNLTPIGASANITAIGILRKNGYEVKTTDFLKIGVPFTLAAVLTGYAFTWLVWGI